MRDIKFRGKINEKGIDNSWIEGSLVHITKTYKGEEDEQECDIYQIINEDGVGFFIDKETIGQYTGLHDKNGKEIYEGDIIDFSYDMFVGSFNTYVAKGIVIFEEGAFYVQCLENENMTKDESYLLYTINIDTIEIIGNIWENGDLLNDSK